MHAIITPALHWLVTTTFNNNTTIFESPYWPENLVVLLLLIRSKRRNGCCASFLQSTPITCSPPGARIALALRVARLTSVMIGKDEQSTKQNRERNNH